MKVYRNSCYESMLSNEQLLDVVNAICPMREVAFILSEFFVNSQEVKKVGNFAVKYGHYIMYGIPGFNKVYGFRMAGTYMVLCPVDTSPDYALCGIIASTLYVVPDEYSYVGEL